MFIIFKYSGNLNSAILNPQKVRLRVNFTVILFYFRQKRQYISKILMDYYGLFDISFSYITFQFPHAINPKSACMVRQKLLGAFLLSH